MAGVLRIMLLHKVITQPMIELREPARRGTAFKPERGGRNERAWLSVKARNPGREIATR